MKCHSWKGLIFYLYKVCVFIYIRNINTKTFFLFPWPVLWRSTSLALAPSYAVASVRLAYKSAFIHQGAKWVDLTGTVTGCSWRWPDLYSNIQLAECIRRKPIWIATLLSINPILQTRHYKSLVVLLIVMTSAWHYKIWSFPSFLLIDSILWPFQNREGEKKRWNGHRFHVSGWGAGEEAFLLNWGLSSNKSQ